MRNEKEKRIRKRKEKSNEKVVKLKNNGVSNSLWEVNNWMTCEHELNNEEKQIKCCSHYM